VRIVRGPLEGALKKAMGGIPHLQGPVSLVVVDDPTIKGLNRKLLGRNRATDVLAYELGRGEGPWGEVIASAQTAKKQAENRKVPIWTELLLYLLHGMLHLAGHDDLADEGFRRMHMAERKLLKRAALDENVIKRLVPDSMVFLR